MTSHTYKFNLDPYTREVLRKFNTSEWIDMFRTILSKRTVRYNIEFSDQDLQSRLFELYDIVGTYSIDEQPFQQALILLLFEYYGNTNKVDESLYLIRAADYVKPSYYYRDLLDLSTNPSLDYMMTVYSEEGLSIQMYLINTVIRFDLLDKDKRLLKYLIKKKHLAQPPEYYQVTIRYLYRLGNQQEFDGFMNTAFVRLNERPVRNLAMITFSEYFFYKGSMALVFNWLLKKSEELQAYYFYHDFIDFVFGELRKRKETYHDKQLFASLFCLLAPAGNFEWLAMVPAVMEELEEYSLEEKKNFFYFLAINHPDLCYAEHSGPMDSPSCFYHGDTVIIVKEGYEVLYFEFYLGWRTAQTSRLMQTRTRDNLQIILPPASTSVVESSFESL